MASDLKHDLWAITTRVRAELKGKHDARHLLVLWKATKRAHIRTYAAIASAWSQDADLQRQRKQLLQELNALDLRLGTYLTELAKLQPEDTISPAVRPLLFNVSGANHFTPDFATPFSIDNRGSILAEYYKQHWSEFWRYFVAELQQVPRLVAEGAAAVAEGTTAVAKGVGRGLFGRALPWVVGGSVVAAAGYTVYRLRAAQ